jgi:hypothetical protein
MSERDGYLKEVKKAAKKAKKRGYAEYIIHVYLNPWDTRELFDGKVDDLLPQMKRKLWDVAQEANK